MADDPPEKEELAQETTPFESNSDDWLAPHVIPAGLAWALVVAVGGGWVCGVLLVRFRLYGYLSLMVVGVLGGAISRRISGRSVRLLGWALVVAVLIAMVLGQVYLLRFGSFRFGGIHIETWAQAFAAWPTLVSGSRNSSLVGLICAGLGAHSAYWRSGKRFLGA